MYPLPSSRSSTPPDTGLFERGADPEPTRYPRYSQRPRSPLVFGSEVEESEFSSGRLHLFKSKNTYVFFYDTNESIYRSHTTHDTELSPTGMALST